MLGIKGQSCYSQTEALGTMEATKNIRLHEAMTLQNMLPLHKKNKQTNPNQKKNLLYCPIRTGKKLNWKPFKVDGCYWSSSWGETRVTKLF